MINIRFIIKIICKLIFLESLFLAICFIVALFYGESDLYAFAISAIISAAISIIVNSSIKVNDFVLAKRDGYFIVTFAWIIISLFGSLPFIIGNTIPSFANAFFETMSGFTTTGSTIMDNIEAMPHATLFWRSLTQWLGGLGIIVLFLALIQSLGIEGRDLYVAETTGPTHSKITNTFSSTARSLWMIYVGLTLLEAILLYLGDMSIFDAICNSFTTMATGGFSTKQASIAYWSSPYIQYVITFFMFVAGVNFSLTYGLITQFDWKKFLKDNEFKVYLGIVSIATLIISINLYKNNWQNGDIEHIFRDAIFVVVTTITTTGFATADYMQWSPVIWCVIIIIMCIGACASSTAGGPKVIRISLLFKNSLAELERIIHPNAITTVKYNKKVVPADTISNIMGFFTLFILIIVISTLILVICGNDLMTSFSGVITSISNVGPGFGTIGPSETFSHMNDFSKIFLAFIMLIGRLEIFTVLVIFTKSFWKN